MTTTIVEPVEDYESKRVEERKGKAALLSIRAREAAGVVEQFGSAVVEGKALISAGDIKMMVYRLNYYADWLMRIANGEHVEEEHIEEMERTIASIRLPKKNRYKRGIIEVIYVGETSSGQATRHKLYELDVDDADMHQGRKVQFDFVIGKGKYGKRLPVKRGAIAPIKKSPKNIT